MAKIHRSVPLRTREENLKTGLVYLFLTFALIFVMGLFFTALNMGKIQDAFLNNSPYVGEPAGTWEPAPDQAKNFKTGDVEVRIIDDQLYLQLKSVEKGMAPELDSLRILEDGSYVAYVNLAEGKETTAVYRLILDRDLSEEMPVVKQNSKGIVVTAEER